MKKIYIQLLLTLVGIFGIQAQTLQTVDGDEFLTNPNGTYSELKPILAGTCVECQVPDLNFNWSNSFDAAVANENYIRRAADKKLREWYERQKIVIENFLENKYHKQFSSFNEAKDYAFIDFESKNMTINVAPIVSTKNSDRIRRAFKKKVHIKGLKALKIREAEIKAGNTNKPLYPDFEVNGTPLKNLKSTAAVTAAYNNLLNQFVDNAWKEFEGRHIIKILGIPFNNKVLKTKNNYYGNLGTWDKLDFMQFIIHYEQITKTSPVPPTEEELRLFKKYINTANTVTATYVENYINANKESEMSLFHPNYWEIIWNRDYDRSLFATKAAKNKHQQLKQKELSRLISSTSMNATFTIDYLVSLLKITDKNQLQWLNDNPSKGNEFVKEINEAKQKDADMPPPIPGELSFPPDHHQQLAQWDIRTELAEGAKVVVLIKELGITDKNQKDWLYDNKPEADNFIAFADENRVSGNIINNVKVFENETIKIFSNQSLTEVEKYKQFTLVYNSFDPILPNTAQKTDYEAKIKKYATSFKQWGNKEFGNYLESLLPLDSSFSDEDYKILYKTIREKAGELAWDYVRAIVGQTFESFKPVIEMALWEVGGGLALKVLSKLPVRYLTTPIRNVITRLTASSSTAFSNLKHAKKYGIQPYKKLGEIFRELGISAKQLGVEKHHLIEKRFAGNPKIAEKLFEKFGKTTDDWLSIVVEKTNKLAQSEHYKFTQAWKKAIGYEGQAAGSTGYTTKNVPYDVLIEQARKIYKDYPEILKALGL
ncbi:hypothetical protein CSC82_34720 [Rhodobacteraceae bacterium 4F10]|nr:hypothetical protein CSC82_34720 [Rhodobacteraceae bacterium 4F10]